jgi:hypothetical protein
MYFRVLALGIHLSEIQPLGALTREETRDVARALWDQAGKMSGGFSPAQINNILEPFRAREPSLSFESLQAAGWLEDDATARRRSVEPGKAALSNLTGQVANAPSQPRMTPEEAAEQARLVKQRLDAAPADIDGIRINSLYLFGSAVRDNSARPTIGDLDIAADFAFDARYDGMDAATRSQKAKAAWDSVLSQGDERLQLGDAKGLPDMADNTGESFKLVKLWQNPATAYGSFTTAEQQTLDRVIEGTIATQQRARLMLGDGPAIPARFQSLLSQGNDALPASAVDALMKNAAQAAPGLDYAAAGSAGPQIGYDKAKSLILGALHDFDPALAASAKEILDNPARMNVREVPEGKGVMMRVRTAGLTPQDAMSIDGHPAVKTLRQDFPIDHNSGNRAIIDFQYDGTMKSVIYLAHELGHALADDTQVKAGRSYRDNPKHMEEIQAYIVQGIVAQGLRNHPDPAIAKAAQQHFAGDIAKQVAAYPVAQAAMDTLDNIAQGHPTDAPAIMEARLGQNWKAALDTNPLYNDVFKAMQGGPDAVAMLEKAVKRLNDRPSSQLIGLGIAEQLQGQDVAARRAVVNAAFGADGPKPVTDVLDMAGVKHLGDFAKGAIESPSSPTARTLLRGWYLLRGFSADFDPLSTIMDMPKDEAIAKMEEVHPTRGIEEPDENGHRDQKKYYQLRADADSWVRDNSDALKDRQNPVFFALTQDPETVRANMNSPGNKVLVMPLQDADLSKFSITFDDSMGNYRTTVLNTKATGINGEFLPDISPMHGTVMNARQFADAIAAHGTTDATGGPRNIEAQYWGTEPLKAQIFDHDPALPKPSSKPKADFTAAAKPPASRPVIAKAVVDVPTVKTPSPDAPTTKGHSGTQAKLGGAAGKAQIAVDVASGNYASAATGTAMEIGLNAKTYEAAAELTSSIKPVAKALGFVGKRIPLIGAVVTGGFVLWEVGSYALNGEYGRATAALGAGAAEAAGNLVGFGVGDAARETVRGVVIATAGDEYAVNKSGLRQLGEGAYAVGSKFVSGQPGGEKPPAAVTVTASAKPKAPGL